ncbi:hypothetical protein MN186_14850 [Aliiroseovarius sp. N1F302]|uniref:hypothetical protein n=1 Tax=Aliiroseovarius sediminis TaxID=2925839 RepID=UPI001F5614FB|nr:hypothetical protein [Aliiroseovarius sediminis]MCI2395721.1 hypothetical protein [Aliiroseovarius sediminis]
MKPTLSGDFQTAPSLRSVSAIETRNRTALDLGVATDRIALIAPITKLDQLGVPMVLAAHIASRLNSSILHVC